MVLDYFYRFSGVTIIETKYSEHPIYSTVGKAINESGRRGNLGSLASVRGFDLAAARSCVGDSVPEKPDVVPELGIFAKPVPAIVQVFGLVHAN